MWRGLNRNIVFLGLLAAAFVLIAVSQGVRLNTTFDNQLSQLKTEVSQARWENAADTLSSINSSWSGRKLWLSINNNRSRIDEFDRALDRVESYILVENKANAVADASLLALLWHQLGG